MEYYCLVLLFHILVVGPLLVYLGLHHATAHSYVWKALIVLGLGVIAYHLALYWNFKNPVNAFHVLVFGPAFILLALYHSTLPTIIWDVVVMMGIGVALFHAYKFYSTKGLCY